MYNKLIRKIIYTTNIIEEMHRIMRKFTKTKGGFTSEMALQKMIYCGIQSASKKYDFSIVEKLA